MVARVRRFGPVGQVDVFQGGHGGGLGDLGLELIGEQAPLLEGAENRLTPGVQLRKLGESGANGHNGNLVQGAGGLFAVSCDERNRGPAFEQLGRRLHLPEP